ncbi:MAG: DNA replication and repair protein RecF [Gemmatimonas sp.]|nr:DNA replication and repair protein RecF [Gemmatimonas sp.]
MAWRCPSTLPFRSKPTSSDSSPLPKTSGRGRAPSWKNAAPSSRDADRGSDCQPSTSRSLYLSSLRLTNFRNFADERLTIPREGVAIVGDNGQGKTNLLEAIYYLEIFRSFRGAPDDQLVRFGEDVCRVEGLVGGAGEARTIAAAYDRRARRKKVTVDGVEPDRIGDALGRVGVVMFSPADVALVSGSPAGRRRFLDIVLSLTERHYLEDLQRYRQILLQRNAVLRAGESTALVSAWNPGLVRAGSRVVAARLRWVRSRRDSFAARIREIANGSDAALEFDPSLPLDEEESGDDLDRVVATFESELARTADREQRRGATLVGPHRDDLRMRAASGGHGEWVDLRVYGSGGQQRTAAVALRMVEADTLRERLGSEPVILLDDVFAELDVGRSQRILRWVDREAPAQVIITAPKPADIELRGGALPVWSIRGGHVESL